MSKTYTLREAKLILRNRALKKTIAILRDQSSEMRRAFLDIQQIIRNNDKDAEIRRLTDELTSRNYLYGQRVDEITMLQHALENSEYWKDKAIWRNKDKDAEIKRLNATIDRTVNAWESRCIEKYDEIKRLNIVIDELIEKGYTYNQQQWSELVHQIQKERERWEAKDA